MSRPRWAQRLARATAAFVAQRIVWLWRRSCSPSVHNDPRPALRQRQQRYVYALLHEHQLAAVLANDEPQLAAMVSRSVDGDVLSAALRATGVVPVRGSSKRDARNKGGQQALAELIACVHAGLPALIAVDGPRGPRAQVRKGIAALARATNAVILPVAIKASSAMRLQTPWDRPLIPLPWARIQLHFGEPVRAHDQPGQDKQTCDVLRARLLQLSDESNDVV